MSDRERAIQLLDEIPNDETLAAFAEVDRVKENGTGQHFEGSAKEFLNMLLEE